MNAEKAKKLTSIPNLLEILKAVEEGEKIEWSHKSKPTEWKGCDGFEIALDGNYYLYRVKPKSSKELIQERIEKLNVTSFLDICLLTKNPFTMKKS